MSTPPEDIAPEEGVDLFLAAPDSVRQSEIERKKLEARKKRAAAEEAQLRATKLDERPTDEDLIADVIRVAEDPDINPFAQFRQISRKRYRLFGHYPIEFADERYGQFEHLKQVAGLEDKPGTREKKAAIAAHSRTAHARRYATRCILPHVNRDAELERAITGTRLVLSISDTHSTFLDPFTWYVFLCACRDLKPDVVYLNGDILEGSEISRYPKIPGWTTPLQLEFDFAREMFRQIREIVPAETRVIWGAGNHGLDRMAKYLTQVAPAFANLRSLRFDKLADLEGLDVTLAQGGTIASPEGEEDASSGMLLYGFYRIHHGTRLGATPAVQELRDAGRSGQSGHVHRSSLVFGTNEADRTKSWMTTPMGCSERAGRAYMKGVTTGWQKGFGVAFLHPGGKVHQYPVLTDNDTAIVEGYIYRRAPTLIEPDVQDNWLVKVKPPR